MSRVYSKNQIRLYFFLALLLLVVPAMFALNWGIVSLVNLEALGSHLVGVFSYAGAIVVAGLMLAYFAKIALKLNKMLKVSNNGQ